MARLSPVKPRIWPQCTSTSKNSQQTTRGTKEDFTSTAETTILREHSLQPRKPSQMLDEVSRPLKKLSKSARSVHGTIFSVFSDCESPIGIGQGHYDYTSPRRDPESRSPLEVANYNALSAPPPSQRPTAAVETDDYDKENDVCEEMADDYIATATQQVPPLAVPQRTMSRTPIRHSGRTKESQQTAHRTSRNHQSESFDDSDNEDSHSLMGFIVSDDEELSYYETSESEAEDEQNRKSDVLQPKPRRRLVRGRRPEATPSANNPIWHNAESKRNSHENESVSEPFSLSFDSEPQKLVETGYRLSEEMNRLQLSDNEATKESEKTIHNEPHIHLGPSPTKAIYNREILVTPPPSPTKNLPSPKREKSQIPPTPYRESSDAFWSQNMTNNWVDQHSPGKHQTPGRPSELLLLEDFNETDSNDDVVIPAATRMTGSTTPKMQSKTALQRAEAEQKRAILAKKKSFDNKKAAFAENFFKILDDAVTGGQIQRLAEQTGGVKIVWSKTLQTTAGRANWKRERSRGGCVVTHSHDTPEASHLSSRHYASIELAERIIDNEDRLLNTLAHEYCHLANFMISNIHNNPHGSSFKQWGMICTQALREHPIYGGRIEVTTKHSYKIDYKYVWCCVDCGQNYGRHSKSIDPSRSRCGNCKGLLQQIKPKPRNTSPKKNPQTPCCTDSVRKRDVDDVIEDLQVVSLRAEE